MRALGSRLAATVSAGFFVFGGGLAVGVVSAGAAALPDGRVFEVVSPVGAGQDANVSVPVSGNNLTPDYEHGVWVQAPFEVASDGEAVAYAGEPPATGGDGNYGIGAGNEFVARRLKDGGWSTSDIQIPGRGMEGRKVQYQAFSDDLSVGILESEEPLTTGVPLEGNDLYSHLTASGGSGDNRPLYEGAPARSLNQVSYKGSIFGGPLFAGGNSGTSSVAEFSHLLLESDVVLNSEAVDGGDKENNLYDSVGGKLYSVNVLPDGKGRPNAVFGSFATYNEGGRHTHPGLSHVISADGSRIFWTALEAVETEEGPEYLPTALYVRKDDASQGARTAQVDEATGGGGFFWTATPDGAKAFFTKGDLYRYDVDTGQTVDLTPGVSVQGVLGISDSGEYVYYVDSSFRLYLWHEGVSTFIATLSPEDDGLAGTGVFPFGTGGQEGRAGDWQPAVGMHIAQVTPDGHTLLFMSNRSLTGYDNEDGGRLLFEVFRYEADGGKLACVSCDPNGEPPIPTNIGASPIIKGDVGAFVPISKEATDQPRAMSSDGSRVFFSSGEPLVPQDTNGWLDVYEWERDGNGSCHESRGCIYLLSGGVDPENSYLIGTDAAGNDAVMVTRAQLVAADRNDDDDVYDARVGGVRPPAATACSGSGCQGVPPSTPIFATPSSLTFEGVGNFVAVPPAHAKQKTLTSAQKLARALATCHLKRKTHTRAMCERQARKRYRSTSRARKSGLSHRGGK